MLFGFLAWERRWLRAGESVLIDPAMLKNPLLRGGLIAFMLQFLLQAGLFFCVPLYLSVALGLSAIDTEGDAADAIMQENTESRVAGLRAALASLALLAIVALFNTGNLPTRQLGAEEATSAPIPASPGSADL